MLIKEEGKKRKRAPDNLRFKIGLGLFNYHHKIMLMNSLEGEKKYQHGALPVCAVLLAYAYSTLIKDSLQIKNGKREEV